ncbi:MAG: DUF4091 domain-containing protein [Planctomycetes bacterium]|nr:DUF4091 domain-containing protein [Planctomycetota bacterium]
MPQVHIAVGMGAASLLGLPMLLWRRRWLIWLPVLMGACGGLALVPDVIAQRFTGGGDAHLPAADAFFMHAWLDRQAALYSPAVSNAAFQAVAFMLLAAACGYAAYIRWGLPRQPEAEEALARLRRETAGYAPAAAVLGVLPLALAGAAVAWVTWPSLTRQAQTPDPLDTGRWAQAVSRRLGVPVGQRLGLVHAAWDPQGAWLCGDLGARVPQGGTPAEVVERAKANGCGFVVLLDAPAPLQPLRAKHGGMAILSGLTCETAGGGAALVLLPPRPDEAGVAAAFRRWQEGRGTRHAGRGTSGEELLQWLRANAAGGTGPLPVVLANTGAWAELSSWQRDREIFAGILGLSGSERLSAREARSQWSPAVAEVGGTWDRFLDLGFRLWGAAAASDCGPWSVVRGPKSEVAFGPGEFARTYVWCPGGRGLRPPRGTEAPPTEQVLDGLRRGCTWAVEGGIVRKLDFGVAAPSIERPARMGEVARLAPDDEAAVELALDVPATDFAGRPSQLDAVELVSNFAGQPAVVASFRNVREAARLTHRLPPAQDHNGGVGFYVRARGWRSVGDGARLSFYTNPIHILVRAGSPAPVSPGAAPVSVASPHRPPEPTPPKPTTAQPVPPAKDEPGAHLAAIGLPPSVRPVLVESFQKPPGRHWRGTHVSIIGDRSPAIGDEELRVSLVQRLPLGAGTRLFFHCYAVECSRLAIAARAAGSTVPHQAVRDLPERQWVAFDLSLAEDFAPLRGSGARLGPPAELEAIEWSAPRLGPLSRFYVTDVAIYEPTPQSRRELALARAKALDEELREAVGRGAPTLARKAADAAAARLAAWAGQLDPKAAQLSDADLAAAERALGELADECRRLRWVAQASRLWSADTGQRPVPPGGESPRFAVSVAPPTQRITTRNPALAPPDRLSGPAELAAAGGEAEAIQLVVIALWDKLQAVRVEVSPLSFAGGSLPSSAAAIELVDDVEVKPRPTLPPEAAGWVPDPLRPFEPFDLEPGAARCVLVTLEVPPDLPPGDYAGHVSVQPRGLDPVRVPVRLRRWAFALEGQPLAIIAPLDEQAIRKQYALAGPLPKEGRRGLYELLLRHRVCPIPLLGGDEEADMEEILPALKRGHEFVALRETASAAPGPNDPDVVRAARCASRLLGAGWGRRGAILLPLAPPEEGQRARLVAAARGLAEERPALLLLAGGDGEPPGDLVAHVWRRPIAPDPPRRPADEDVEVRLSRTARREGWDLAAQSPELQTPSLLLSSPLAHVRLLPWLAWQHGVRALFLRGVNRWGDADDLRGEALLYPGSPEQPHASLRLAALRDGVEDYACLRLLWDRARLLRERNAERHAPLVAAAERLLAEAAGAAGTLRVPCRDPQLLAALRVRLAREIERLDAAWWAEVDSASDLPPPPAELTARPGDRQVALAWAKSPDPKATAYNVFRSREPKSGFARINPLPIEGLSYADGALENDVTYHYFVRSLRGGTVDGPRSQTVSATTRPGARAVWLPGPPPGQRGPHRVAVRLDGPGTGGLLPLVRPQADYALADAAPHGFDDMTRQDDGTWTLDIPEPGKGWASLAGKKLRILVRLVDRQGRVATPPVERVETISPPAKTK